MSDQICIRCGSRAHTTRDHDEGKAGGTVNNSAAAKKKAAAAAAAKKGTDSSEGVKKLYVHHDHCWARPARNPGIPDVIEPPFRMQSYKDPCIASWQDRDVCLCKECEKRRKKAAFVENQRKQRIASRGKFG